jgi:hypothetical protein
MKPFVLENGGTESTLINLRHSGQAKREPESSPATTSICYDDGLDSGPGLLSAGVTFFRGNDAQDRDDAGVRYPQSSTIAQRFHPRQLLASQKFQRGAAAG